MRVLGAWVAALMFSEALYCIRDWQHEELDMF